MSAREMVSNFANVVPRTRARILAERARQARRARIGEAIAAAVCVAIVCGIAVSFFYLITN